MEKLKIRKNIKSGIKEVDDYIDTLHNHIESFDTSSVKMLLMALDEASGEIAKDVVRISRGDLDNLTVMTDDSKAFDKLLKIMEKIDYIKKISELAQELKPDIEDFNAIVKDLPKLDSGNVFEQAQKMVRDKRKGK